jgi:hypothetical protein
MKKYVIYTALFGKYLSVIEIAKIKIFNNFDYVLFTDQNITVKNWKVVKCKPMYGSPFINNRYYKFLPHRLFQNYDVSLYIDSNIILKKNPIFLLKTKLRNKAISINKHYRRKNIEDEIAVCIAKKKTNKQKALEFYKTAIKKNFFKDKYLMTDNSIILRKHNNPKLIIFNECLLKSYIKDETLRDQFYSYLFNVFKIKFEPLDSLAECYVDKDTPKYKNFYFDKEFAVKNKLRKNEKNYESFSSKIFVRFKYLYYLAYLYINKY